MPGSKPPKKKKGIRRIRKERHERYLKDHDENLLRQKQWRALRKGTEEDEKDTEGDEQDTEGDEIDGPVKNKMSDGNENVGRAPFTCRSMSPELLENQSASSTSCHPDRTVSSDHYCADSLSARIFEQTISAFLRLMGEKITGAKEGGLMMIDGADPFILDVWPDDTLLFDGTLVSPERFTTYQAFLDFLLKYKTFDALCPAAEKGSCIMSSSQYPECLKEFTTLTFQSRFILAILHILGWHAISAYEERSTMDNLTRSTNHERLLTVKQCFDVYVALSRFWMRRCVLAEFGDFSQYLQGLASRGWTTLHAFEKDRLIYIRCGNDKEGGKGGLFVDLYIKTEKGTYGRELAFFCKSAITPWDLIMDD